MDPYIATVQAIAIMDTNPLVRVDKLAKQAATAFIWSLREQSLPVPDVGPSPDGGVAMAWVFTTTGGELELDAIFFGWDRIEYREGYVHQDGFVEDTVLGDGEQLRGFLLRALDASAHVA